LEEAVSDGGSGTFGGHDLGRIKFDGLHSGVSVGEGGAAKVVHILIKELLGEAADSVVTILGFKSRVDSDLVHKTLVFSLLAAETGHPAKFWNQIN
jgi:hypothetical protein